MEDNNAPETRKSKLIYIIPIIIVILIGIFIAAWFYSRQAKVLIISDAQCQVQLQEESYDISPNDTAVIELVPGEYKLKATESRYNNFREKKLTIESRSQIDTLRFAFSEEIAEEELFEQAEKDSTIAGYKKYLSQFPDGKYAEKSEKQVEYLTSLKDSAEIVRDEAAFKEAQKMSTISAFENYKEEFPDGIYVNEANEQIKLLKKLDREAFEAAKEEHTILAYQTYMRKNPEGLYLTEAQKMIKQIEEEIARRKAEKEAWEVAKNKNTIEAYEDFLNKFPEGIFYSEASEILEVLKKKAHQEWLANEDPTFMKAQRTGTIESYQEYLTEYPNGKYAEQVKEVIKILKVERAYQQKAPPGMVYVAGGSFEMGSNKGKGDESPVHKVILDKFYMSRFEVTNQQYADFLNKYESDVVKSGQFAGQDMIFEDEWGLKKENGKWRAQYGKEKHPVVYVTWYGANEYCKYYGYRLPTEAEWEYAARGGNKSQDYKYAGSNNPDKVAWYYDNARTTKPVGLKIGNELGIFDMTGNVWEWCYDWHEKNYYRKSPGRNPQGPSSGSAKVLRGGSFFEISSKLRVTYRDFSYPIIGYYNYGFRCVKDINE